jgi:O-antigen/teichoic acid export membrane protein
MGLLIGATPLGLFRAGAQIANVLNPFLQAMISYLPSRASAIMAREGKAGLRRMLRKMLVRMAIPFSLICIAVMLLAEPLLKLAYGDKFLNQGLEGVIVLVALTSALSFVKALQRIVFMAMEQSRPLFVASVMSAVLLATSGVALIYFIGIWGAPLSNLIQIVASVTYFWFVYRRLMKEKPADLPVSSVRPVPVEVGV